MSARASRVNPLELNGRRIRLRTTDRGRLRQWFEVRARCRDWLVPWEPRPDGSPTTPEDRASFVARCAARERERQMGTGYGFGIFVDGRLAARSPCRPSSGVPSRTPSWGIGWTGPWPARAWPPRPRWLCCASLSRNCPCIGSRWPSSPATGPAGGWWRSSFREEGRGLALSGDRRTLGGPRPLRDHVRGMGRPQGELVGRLDQPRLTPAPVVPRFLVSASPPRCGSRPRNGGSIARCPARRCRMPAVLPTLRRSRSARMKLSTVPAEV